METEIPDGVATSGGKQIIALLLCIIAFAVVMFIIFYPSLKKQSQAPKITNFQQCVAAGYPVMQSYPPECSLPNGQFFTQQVVPER
jgi:hypothetical protein